MYGRTTDDMDVDSGGILAGEKAIAEAGERIFQLMLRAVGDEGSRATAWTACTAEFAPWVRATISLRNALQWKSGKAST